MGVDLKVESYLLLLLYPFPKVTRFSLYVPILPSHVHFNHYSMFWSTTVNTNCRSNAVYSALVMEALYTHV